MKISEEKYTAWIDGKLADDELAAFERDLASMENAAADKASMKQLGSLLRGHLQAPALSNADFFNHQLMQRIESEQPRAAAPRRAVFWSLPRMAWAGACLLAVAGGLYVATVPKTAEEAAAGHEYVARILNAKSDDPAITATAFHSKGNNVTVLWLDGLDYISAEQKLK